MHPNLRSTIPYLFFFVLAYALFANTFFSVWVMDDHAVVQNNPDIRSWAAFIADSYPGRPLRELTYLIDYQIFGNNPNGYHVQNIFWHALNAALIFILGFQLTGRRAIAWASALLFIVHPLTVEVVANISHRKDSLALAFCLVALLAFLKVYQLGRVRWLWLLLAGICTFIAYLGKQNAIGVVLVFIAYDATYHDKTMRLIFRRKIIDYLFGAGLAIGIMAWYGLAWRSTSFIDNISQGLINLGYPSTQPVEDFLKITLKSTAFIFQRIIWPADLAMEYIFPVPEKWINIWVLAGIVFLFAGVLALFLCYRYAKTAFIGLVFMFALWLPASNLIWPLTYLAADRYMYGPLAGFSLFSCILLFRILHNHEKTALGIIVCICMIFSILTWQQNKTWRSDLALSEQMLKASPNSLRALKSLGLAHRQRFEFDKAIYYFEEAAKLRGDSRPLQYLAEIYELRGNRKQALNYYRRFVLANEYRYHAEVRKVKKHLLQAYGLRY